MKKSMFLICAIFLLLFSVASVATGNGNGKNNGNTQAEEEELEDLRALPEAQAQNRFQEMIQVEEQSKVRGLENAMLRVRNEETKRHLEQVLAKIEAKRAEQLNKKENLTCEEQVDGSFACRYKDKAKFLGFMEVKKEYKYEVLENGGLNHKRGQWDFLFKEEETI